MATSAVAYGKIEIALRTKSTVPKGWIVDKGGRATTDPQDMIDGGAQLPLGSEKELGGHKGYALAAMVDILCCILSGANWGPFAPPFALRQEIPERTVGKGIGHFFGAMQIDGFIDKDEFKKQIDEWIRVFRKTKPAPGTKGPLIPGDPEREAEAIRSKAGIPLLKPVVDDLLEISRKTGIPFESR
jgi:L-2-hydroxycarboxylate dehydrogenase (NAD+)